MMTGARKIPPQLSCDRQYTKKRVERGSRKGDTRSRKRQEEAQPKREHKESGFSRGDVSNSSPQLAAGSSDVGIDLAVQAVGYGAKALLGQKRDESRLGRCQSVARNEASSALPGLGSAELRLTRLVQKPANVTVGGECWISSAQLSFGSFWVIIALSSATKRLSPCTKLSR